MADGADRLCFYRRLRLFPGHPPPGLGSKRRGSGLRLPAAAASRPRPQWAEPVRPASTRTVSSRVCVLKLLFAGKCRELATRQAVFLFLSGKCRQGTCECRDMLTMLTSSVMARLQFSFRREMPRAPHKTLHRAQYRLVITISPNQTNPSTARTIHAPEHHNLRHHPPPQGVTQGESGTTQPHKGVATTSNLFHRISITLK